MAFCELLYAGFLCVQAVSGGAERIVESGVRAEVWGVHPTSGVRVEASGWSVLVIRGSDVLSTINPKAMSQACEGEVCVRYHLHCAPVVDQKTDCHYTIMRDGADQPAEITVTAYGPERQRAALRSLSFVTPTGVRIRFEKMSKRSTRESPYCARIRRASEGPEYEPDCDFLNR